MSHLRNEMVCDVIGVHECTMLKQSQASNLSQSWFTPTKWFAAQIHAHTHNTHTRNTH